MSLIKKIIFITLLSISSLINAAAVNVNKASAEEIAAALSGVGESKAASIVNYRNKHGEFKKLSDLTGVKGIGAGTVNKNKANIIFK